MRTLAEQYIALTDLWLDTDKDVIIDNFERIFGEAKILIPRKDNTRTEVFIKATGKNRNAIASWFNRSRTNVSFPLLQLCKIAVYLHTDVIYLLENHGDWRCSEKLSARQVEMYKTARKAKQFYSLDFGWNIPLFVQCINSLEDYEGCGENEKKTRLLNDCEMYFKEVVLIFYDEISENIKTEVEKIVFN